jgi:hypothetical protein
MPDVIKKAIAVTGPFTVTLGILMTAGLNGTVERDAPRYTFVGTHSYLETPLRNRPGRAQTYRPTSEKDGAANTDLILWSIDQGPVEASYPAAETCRNLGPIWHMASSAELLHAARISSRWDAPFEGAFWASDLTKDGQSWKLVYPRRPDPVRTTENPTRSAQVLCVNKDLN